MHMSVCNGVEVNLRVWLWVYVKCLIFFRQGLSPSLELASSASLSNQWAPGIAISTPHAGVVNMRCDTWVLGMWTLVLLFTHQVISPNPSHGSLSAKTFKHPWRLSIFLHLCFYDDTTAISCLIHCFPNWDPVAFILQSQWSKNLNLEQGSGDTHL